eukprot:763686-Hanusia_phi.AAC.4
MYKPLSENSSLLHMPLPERKVTPVSEGDRGLVGLQTLSGTSELLLTALTRLFTGSSPSYQTATNHLPPMGFQRTNMLDNLISLDEKILVIHTDGETVHFQHFLEMAIEMPCVILHPNR